MNPAFLLDRWLWRRGMGHPVIMPVVRNEMLAAFAAVGAGAALYALTPWILWFGVGLSVMALTFFSLAQFFLRRELGAYSTALFLSVLARWGVRLLLIACVLYVALVVCGAPVSAILAGLVTASILALVTYAFHKDR